MSNVTLKVLRIGGEPLEKQVSRLEIERLRTIHDLKECLALADPLRPPVCCVELLRCPMGGHTEVLDDLSSQIPWEDIDASFAKTSVQYLVSQNVIPLLLKAMDERDELATIPELLSEYRDHIAESSWSDVISHEAFDLLFGLGCGAALRGNDFFDALDFEIRTLSVEEVNRVHEDGTTVLLFLTKHYNYADHRYTREKLENVMLSLLSREDLETRMVHSVLQGGFRNDVPSIALFLNLRKKQMMLNACPIGGGSLKVARELLEYASRWDPEMLGKSCRWGDTMLHHILEPMCPNYSHDKDVIEADFCIALAERMTLGQLCHRNDDRVCALSYAETFASSQRPFFKTYMRAIDMSPWVRLRDTIKTQLISKASQLQSLRALLRAIEDMRDAVLSAAREELETEHLESVIAALEVVSWDIAAQFREEWCGRGWRFVGHSHSEQVAEVIGHFLSYSS